MNLFDDSETMGLPVIECEYNLPGCGQWTVPINQYWGGYTPNDTGGNGGGNAGQSQTTPATQPATGGNTPSLGQPPTTATQWIDGVDNTTLLLIAAGVGLVAIAR